MAANGRLPQSQLLSIPGSGPYGAPQLRIDAAWAYRALDAYSRKHFGVSMALHEGPVGRAYRNYDRQVLAERTYGDNAAEPGTSNHGWGINVDLMNRAQRAVIDKVGHLFGFSKRWSDAAWEWWHITFRSGTYRLVAAYKRAVRALRYGDSGKKVKVLQGRLIAVLGKKNQQGVPKRGQDGRGFFGRATRRAVKAFQTRQGLSADGVVGSKTWRSLKRAVQRRKR